MSIRVAIFEDNTDLRDGLYQLFNTSNQFKCTGAWDNCGDAVDKIASFPCDVAIMDIGFPGRSGVDAVKEIKQHFPKIDVVMFTVYEDEKKIFDSICAGASGYLLKKTPPQKILEAIVDIYNGGAQMNGSVAKKVLAMFQKNFVVEEHIEHGLSAREREVLQFLVKGQSYKMIADSLFISIDTVRSHIKKIYEKLHVHTKSEAIVKAFKNRLV